MVQRAGTGVSFNPIDVLFCEPIVDPYVCLMPVKLVLATRNPGKVAEMKALLQDLPVELYSVTDFPDAPIVEEDAPNLEGNAHKKAVALHAHTGLPALADDTGLEVAALGGRPGVHSARFAGPEANDATNRMHLAEQMHSKQNRHAQFRTVIAFAESDGVSYFEGVCKGVIIDEERGAAGFGYDPLFVPAGKTRTFAEMSKVEKNTISHRGRALAAFIAFLENKL